RAGHLRAGSAGTARGEKLVPAALAWLAAQRHQPGRVAARLPARREVVQRAGGFHGGLDREQPRRLLARERGVDVPERCREAWLAGHRSPGRWLGAARLDGDMIVGSRVKRVAEVDLPGRADEPRERVVAAPHAAREQQPPSVRIAQRTPGLDVDSGATRL